MAVEHAEHRTLRGLTDKRVALAEMLDRLGAKWPKQRYTPKTPLIQSNTLNTLDAPLTHP